MVMIRYKTAATRTELVTPAKPEIKPAMKITHPIAKYNPSKGLFDISNIKESTLLKHLREISEGGHKLDPAFIWRAYELGVEAQLPKLKIIVQIPVVKSPDPESVVPISERLALTENVGPDDQSQPPVAPPTLVQGQPQPQSDLLKENPLGDSAPPASSALPQVIQLTSDAPPDSHFAPLDASSSTSSKAAVTVKVEHQQMQPPQQQQPEAAHSVELMTYLNRVAPGDEHRLDNPRRWLRPIEVLDIKLTAPRLPVIIGPGKYLVVHNEEDTPTLSLIHHQRQGSNSLTPLKLDAKITNPDLRAIRLLSPTEGLLIDGAGTLHRFTLSLEAEPTLTVTHTLEGHFEKFELGKTAIIALSTSHQTVKFITPTDLTEKHTIHNDTPVLSLYCHDDQVYFGREDGQIKICPESDPSVFRLVQVQAPPVTHLTVTAQHVYAGHENWIQTYPLATFGPESKDHPDQLLEHSSAISKFCVIPSFDIAGDSENTLTCAREATVRHLHEESRTDVRLQRGKDQQERVTGADASPNLLLITREGSLRVLAASSSDTSPVSGFTTTSVRAGVSQIKTSVRYVVQSTSEAAQKAFTNARQSFAHWLGGAPADRDENRESS